MIKNNVALITGATSGIGLAIAKLFVSKNAIVYLNYHKDDEKAISIVEGLKKEGGECYMVKADVSVKEEVEKMIEKIIDTHGKIDILINNACPRLTLKSFERLSSDELEKDIDVIVKGALYLSQAVIPHMKKNQYGRIVNLLSIAIIGRAPTHMSSYIVSKSALYGMTKALAVELASYNITVNSVSPGFTETALVEDVPSKLLELYKENNPIKRLAIPEDVARVVLFLCSRNSDYLTGINIPICGGNVM